MLNVRVNRISGNSVDHNRISLDINSNTIAGIYGRRKHLLMYLLSGQKSFDGDIVLNSVSLKGNYEEYLEQIAFLTKDSPVSTNLSVNDFLDFFGSMDHVINDQYENRKKTLLKEFGLHKSMDTAINQLKEKDQKIVKLISLFLKERSLILLDAFLESFQNYDFTKVIHFLKKYADKDKIVLICSEDYKLLKSMEEPIYIID